jgi:IS5 family transposase
MNVPRVRRKSDGTPRRVFEAAKQQFAPKGLYGPVVARSMSGDPYGRHTLPETLKQEAILSDVKPEVVLVDLGYKGVATGCAGLPCLRPTSPKTDLLFGDTG